MNKKNIAKALAENENDRLQWEQEGKPKMEALKKTIEWKTIEQAIDTLVEQKKIVKNTSHDRIINYIINTLQASINLSLEHNNTSKINTKNQHSIWPIIEKSISNLVDNHDLEEKAPREEIVTIIIQHLIS